VPPVPPDFQFNQSNLQDYVDCPQRFLLRHLLKVAWPALEAEPVLENELAMQRGAQFHSLVQQHLLGIPEDSLTLLAQEEALSRWWQAYLSSIPTTLKGVRLPEMTLSAPLQRYRLLAKYDLLVLPTEGSGGRAVIYDWKTSAKKTRRQYLLGRMQTRVYPYLLVQASAFLNQGIPFRPDQVEMIYWYAEAPIEPEVIAYSQEQFQKDSKYLEALAGEIAGLKQDDFNLTPHEERCGFCTYRSLCERGVSASILGAAGDGEVETSEVEDFNFEQIAEIVFS
jgi:CRISPR/Cas system-associated exonuclease Cas4 (RecB family)